VRPAHAASFGLTRLPQSNGPFEILPVVTDFFRISQLPPGSVKLRSYAGRALFGGLFTAPATRKRAGVLDVLDSFPFSRFVLIGDSGEQDLELYAQLAFERPRQVLADCARAGGADGPAPPLDDPTGAHAADAAPIHASPAGTPSLHGTGVGGTSGTGGILSASLSRSDTTSSTASDLVPPQLPYAEPGAAAGAEAVAPRRGSLSSDATPRAVPYAPYKSRSSRQSSASSLRSDVSATGYFAQPARSPAMQTTFTGTPVAEEPEHPESARDRRSKDAQLSEPERRRMDLQARVHRARALIPPTIPLRIFRDPQECIEAAELLDKLHIGRA
jgi:hypothetical protein